MPRFCAPNSLVGFHSDKSLHPTDRNQIADLRPDTGDSRLKGTEPGAGSAIAGDLVKKISIAEHESEVMINITDQTAAACRFPRSA
jgi:hypothetical protein